MDIVHSPFSHIEKQGEFSKKNVDATHNVWRKINIFFHQFLMPSIVVAAAYTSVSHTLLVSSSNRNILAVFEYERNL